MSQIVATAEEQVQVGEVIVDNFALQFVDDAAYEFVGGGTAVNSY